MTPDIEVAIGLNVMDPEVKDDADTVELLASRRPGNNEVDAYERVLTDALNEYNADVKALRFPEPAESYS